LKLKRPGAVAALARGVGLGHQFADRREQARVGGRVAARRAADGALVDVDDLVEILDALDRLVLGRLFVRAVQRARHGGVERVVHQRRFARARDARHAGQEAHRESDAHVLQVVAGRADHADFLQVALRGQVRRFARGAAFGRGAGCEARGLLAFVECGLLHDRQPGGAVPGHLDLAHAREVLARERFGVGRHLGIRALRHHAAAVHARAGAHVDHVVGGVDHVLVVLDHDHAVADVAQVLQRADEPVVVALVQADAGLVEHVHHAREARADLRGQADALRLAARERLGAAVQAQVVEAHVVQEFQAQADLAHHLVGDVGLGAAQLERLEPGERIAQREVAQLEDRHARRLAAVRRAGRFVDQEHVARFGPQPRAAAIGAGLQVAKAREVFAHQHRIGLAVAPRHVGDDPLEGVLLRELLAREVARLHGVVELDLFGGRAVQQHLLHRGRQRFEGRVHVELVVLGDALDHAEVIAVAAVPALDGAAGDRERREGHHARRIEHLAVAQAVAAGAGAHGRIEREEARLQLRQRVVADRAGELGVEQVFLVGHTLGAQFQRNRAAFGQAQRGLEALGQALLHVGARAQAVDHHVDVVLLGLLELGEVVVFVGLAIDAKAHVARGLHLGEELQELAFLLARHGRQDQQARLVGNGQRRIDHLRDGLRLQRQVVVGAVGRAGAGVQEAQVVVDLGHRAHGGARVVAGGLLLDADRGRQALDHVHIGLVHELQELPRIGRQAFDIAPLPFGIQRVEGQARLARARQAGDHHQLVARNVQVDVLQVVGARTANADALLRQHRAEVGVAFELCVACTLRVVVGVFSGFGIQGGDRPRATGHDSPSGISWRIGGFRRFHGRFAGRRVSGARRRDAAGRHRAQSPVLFLLLHLLIRGSAYGIGQ
jgi:hypothetical protein